VLGGEHLDRGVATRPSIDVGDNPRPLAIGAAHLDLNGLAKSAHSHRVVAPRTELTDQLDGAVLIGLVQLDR